MKCSGGRQHRFGYAVGGRNGFAVAFILCLAAYREVYYGFHGIAYNKKNIQAV